MLRNRRSKPKILLIILAAVIVYNEYISYSIKRWLSWPNLRCSNSSKCLKLLLVADPQILGEQYEIHFPRGFLTRWDSDRYLYKTYHRALSHVDPDVIVFLGDIMDEGNIATNEEFRRYLERFYGIFHTNRKIKFVFIPGDNDVGGEHEPLNVKKLERFHETFNQPEVIQFQHADVYKVNRLAYTIPRIEKTLGQTNANKTRLVFSHLPLLFMPSGFVQQVVTQLRPHAIFTAHDHKSLHVSAETETGEDRSAEMLPPGAGPVWQFQLNAGITHEIMVPTCSYRMGVLDMGYGVAVFDFSTDTMLYAVLWLPSRFAQLYLYAGSLILIIMLLLITLCQKACSKMKHKFRRLSLTTKHIV